MTSVKWAVQHASFDPKRDDGILHVGRGSRGIFEIYEYEGHFLLHTPKSINLPSELFSALEDAKTAALNLDGADLPAPPTAAKS